MVEIVERLNHLVSLDHVARGGPYAGVAARECVQAMRDAAAEIERLKAEVERLREALKFYADKSNWTNPFGCPPAIHDHGEKARAALTSQEKTDD
jgi:glutamate-1-semialdehyde aminotransferase